MFVLIFSESVNMRMGIICYENDTIDNIFEEVDLSSRMAAFIFMLYLAAILLFVVLFMALPPLFFG
jgi:hypothetical protein